MTCPFPILYLQEQLKELSRSSLPLCRDCAAVPQRGVRGDARADPRPAVYAVRRSYYRRPDQIEDEFKHCLDLSTYLLKCMGMENDVTYRFSKRGKDKAKYIDNDAAWESTQKRMKEILDDIGLDYVEADDEAAFYGPKLDVQAKNVYGKEDTLITLQLGFAAGERFGMSYIDENGEKQVPFVIHRSSIGCYERTLAMLIEKYAGRVPALDRSRPGQNSSRNRPRERLCRAAAPSADRRGGCAERRITATRRSAIRSARRSCRRSPTCSSWGTRKRRAERSRSEAEKRAISAR